MTDKKTDKKSTVRICSKHNIPMVSRIIGQQMVPILDEEGHEVGEKEEDVYALLCDECEYERQMEQYNISDQPADVAKAIEEFKESPYKKPINKPTDKDFIGKYSKFISETMSVPLPVAQASCEFLISIALYDVKYVNTKGRVLSNEAYRHIAESGHSKSPLFKFLSNEVIPYAFSGYNYYMIGRGTSRGFTSMVQREKNNDRIHIIFMKDEDSVLYKADTHNKDMFEGYSDLFDGNIPSNTTNANGHQTQRKCVASYWSTGTPISMKYIDADFFEQGWAWRLLPIMDDSPIPELDIVDMNLIKVTEMTTSIIRDLGEMTKIGAVESTQEFMDALNHYYNAIVKEKNDVESRINDIGTLSMEWVQTESKTKAPEHIIKLAMIRSASRWNIDNGTVIMDIEDFNYAVGQFEFYRSQMLKFFSEWIDKRESVGFTEQSQRILQIIRSEKERYNLKLIQQADIGKDGREIPEIWDAIPDPKGKWVKRSHVLQRIHLNSEGYNGFNSLIDTLVATEQVSAKDAKLVNTTKTKDGKKTTVYKPTSFLCINNTT